MDQDRRKYIAAMRQLWVAIRCVWLVGCAGLPGCLPAQNPLEKIVDFQCAGIKTEEAILQLSDASGITIAFNPQILTGNRLVQLNLTQTPLGEVLRLILADEKVDIRVSQQQIFLSRKISRKLTVKGYVTDRESGEHLPGANIFLQQLKRNIATNEFGFFSFTLESGSYDLVVSYIGYKSLQRTLQVQENMVLRLDLEESYDLEEVLITARPGDTAGIRSLSNLRKLPVRGSKFFNMPGGESDVLRLAQYLPGVTTGVDGIGGLHVRGGNADQNLLLLDDATIYNPGHIFGLLSIFNDQIIKDVQFWKGNFPARYHGRTSSVMEIRTKEGNLNGHDGEVSTSLIAAKAMVEGYLVKDKLSFILAGRKSFIDPFVVDISRKNKQNSGGFGQTNYDFYDVNAKLHWVADDKNRLYLSFYSGRDDFRDVNSFTDTLGSSLLFSNNQLALQWGNIAGTLRWNRLYGNRLFSNTTLTYSSFVNRFETADYLLAEGEATITSDQGLLFRSEINDISGKIDFSWFPSPHSTVRFGGGYTLHRFNPGVVSFYNYFISGTDIDSLLNSLADSLITKAPRIAKSTHFYLEDEFTPNAHWRIYLGANLSFFSVDNQIYAALQPRIDVNYAPRKEWIFKAGFSRMMQPLHQLNSFNAGLPNDLWVPATQAFGPQYALQWDGGITWLQPRLSIQMEMYYKRLTDIISFREGASFLYDGGSLESDRWENQITTGTGTNYGVEMLITYNKGHFSAWAAYTLAYATRWFSEINLDRVFPFGYDRRHNIKSILAYQFNRLISVSANLTYETGNPVTLSAVRYQIYSPVSNINDIVYFIGERNGYRLPPLHRVDLGIQFRFPQKNAEHSLHLGVYNVYNRKNPFLYYVLLNENMAEVRQLTVLPVLPVFKYAIFFK